MVYSEKEFKELQEKYKKDFIKLQKAFEIKEKENKILESQLKQKDEVIHDLDKNNFKNKYISAEIEIKELKKKSNRLRRAIRHNDKKRKHEQ